MNNNPVQSAPPVPPAAAGSTIPGEPAPMAAPESPPSILQPAQPPAGAAAGSASTAAPGKQSADSHTPERAPAAAALPIVPVVPMPAQPVASPSPLPPEGAPPAPPVRGVDPLAVVPPPEPPPAPEPMAVVEPMVPEGAIGTPEVGRLFSAEEIALVHEPQSNTFHRIANSRLLRPQDRIVSLPTSRVLAFGENSDPMIDGGRSSCCRRAKRPADLELASGRGVSAIPAADHDHAPRGNAEAPGTGVRRPGGVRSPRGGADGRPRNPARRRLRLWGVSGEFTWQPATPPAGRQAPVAMGPASGRLTRRSSCRLGSAST